MPDIAQTKPCRIGLIVNPIAGIGGAAGLQGSDGRRAAEALLHGATPVAADRARTFLRSLGEIEGGVEFLTCGGAMGQDELAAAGIPAKVVHTPVTDHTTASDTQDGARALLEQGVELIVFAGGDGTAADILGAVGEQVPLLGIPAGVKMHSAVFAASPRAAADALVAFLAAADRTALLRDAEIMDRPDDGSDAPSPELVGFARVPDVPRLIVSAKAMGSSPSVDAACRDVLERIDDSRISLLGPGRTLRQVKAAFASPGSLLGVDAVHKGQLIGSDLTEAEAWDLIAGKPARIVVSVVGGQGFLFGRGNQQLSARIIRAVGRENILVVASMEKLAALADRRLLVDTGDEDLDSALAGYLPVLVGYRKTLQMPVGLPAAPIDDRNAQRRDLGAAAHE